MAQEFLGTICDIKTGKLDVNAESINGAYPFFTCAEKPVKIDFFDYDCECVLIAGNGEFAVNYYKGKFNAYQRTYILTAKDAIKDDVYLPYLYSVLQPAIFELKSQSQGSIIQYLRLPQLESLELPFPKVGEQKRIAAILDKADRLRRQRRFAQTLSDSFLQSIFIKMFGDPATDPKGFTCEELGGLIVGFEAGINFNEVPAMASDGWSVLKISAVTWGDFNSSESKLIAKSERIPDSIVVRNGDLLISRANTSEMVGAVSMVPYQPIKKVLPDKLWRIKFNRNSAVVPEYVLHLLRHKHLRRLIGELATGTSGSMKNISMEKAKTLPILLAPLSLQGKFATIVQKFERIRRQQREATRQAEHLFQTLLHRAFRGEL